MPYRGQGASTPIGVITCIKTFTFENSSISLCQVRTKDLECSYPKNWGPTQGSHLLRLGPHSQNGPILGTQHIHSHIVVCGSTMGVNYGWFNYGVLTIDGLTMGGLTMGVNLIGMLTILVVREWFSKCDPLNEECPHTNTLPYIEGSSI